MTESKITKTDKKHYAQNIWDIPVAELSRRAGQTKKLEISLPAPDGIGDSFSGIKAESDVNLNAIIESLEEGLLFTGILSARLTGECSRCAEPIDREITANATALFVDNPPEEKHSGNVEKNFEDEEESEDVYELRSGGAFLNVESLLRDCFVDSLPLQPLCREDCAGLCAECGESFDDGGEHNHQTTDNRWDALKELRDKMEG